MTKDPADAPSEVDWTLRLLALLPLGCCGWVTVPTVDELYRDHSFELITLDACRLATHCINFILLQAVWQHAARGAMKWIWLPLTLTASLIVQAPPNSDHLFGNWWLAFMFTIWGIIVACWVGLDPQEYEHDQNGWRSHTAEWIASQVMPVQLLLVPAAGAMMNWLISAIKEGQ